MVLRRGEIVPGLLPCFYRGSVEEKLPLGMCRKTEIRWLCS